PPETVRALGWLDVRERLRGDSDSWRGAAVYRRVGRARPGVSAFARIGRRAVLGYQLSRRARTAAHRRVRRCRAAFRCRADGARVGEHSLHLFRGFGAEYRDLPQNAVSTLPGA